MAEMRGAGADGATPDRRRPGRPIAIPEGPWHKNPAIDEWLHALTELVGDWFPTRKDAALALGKSEGHFSKVAKGDAYLKREDLQKLFTYCGELTDHVQAHFYRMYMAALKEQKEDLHRVYVLEDEHEAAVVQAAQAQQRYEQLGLAFQEVADRLQDEQNRTRQLEAAKTDQGRRQRHTLRRLMGARNAQEQAEEDLARQRIRCETLQQQATELASDVTQARHERDQARAEVRHLRAELQQAQSNLNRLQEEQQQRLADEAVVAEAAETVETALNRPPQAAKHTPTVPATHAAARPVSVTPATSPTPAPTVRVPAATPAQATSGRGTKP
ncbi:hypothetical protein ABMX48_37460, partial [Streptomyces cavourensis]